MKNDPKKLLRYTPSERAKHWLTAILFFLAALSGLSFFQPFFYPLTICSAAASGPASFIPSSARR